MDHLPHIDGLFSGGEWEVVHEPEVHGIKCLRVPGTHWKASYRNAINPFEAFLPAIDTPVAVEVLYTGGQDFHLQSCQALQPLDGFPGLGLSASSDICPVPRDYKG